MDSPDNNTDSNILGQWLGTVWQAQLGDFLVMLTGPQPGTQIWGPLGQENVCPNGYQICVQQFGQLSDKGKSAKAQALH